MGDAVEPAAQHLRVANGRRVAHEDQERRLEGVVHVRGVGEDLAARGEDARAVPADDSFESGRVAVAAERGQ